MVTIQGDGTLFGCNEKFKDFGKQNQTSRDFKEKLQRKKEFTSLLTRPAQLRLLSCRMISAFCQGNGGISLQ